MTRVLVVCTANRCRSPLGAALLSAQLRAAQPEVEVASAGLLPGGLPVPPEVLDVGSRYGVDLSAHRSRQLTRGQLAAADLVLAMARLHLREAVVLHRAVWPRAFTWRELVRRGGSVGRRPAGTPVEEWLAAVGAGRRPRDLLGDAEVDDVADPIGGPMEGYERLAAGLSQLTQDLARLVWPPPAGGASGLVGR